MTSHPDQEAAQREFREYCRAWLTENRPPPAPVRLPQHPIETMTRAQLDYLQAWQRRCYDAGLVGATTRRSTGAVGTRASSASPMKR
jgi:hypothetical protein